MSAASFKRRPMPMSAGVRLGPYEILSAIGAGGMGEVWKARDTTLGRDVALKILPDHLALDPDRLARFKREAQILASLNHPNIADNLWVPGSRRSAGARTWSWFLDGTDAGRPNRARRTPRSCDASERYA